MLHCVLSVCVCVFDVVWRLGDGIGLFMARVPGRRFHWLFFAIRHLFWISCGCWASCLVYVLIETLCFEYVLCCRVYVVMGIHFDVAL